MVIVVAKRKFFTEPNRIFWFFKIMVLRDRFDTQKHTWGKLLADELKHFGKFFSRKIFEDASVGNEHAVAFGVGVKPLGGVWANEFDPRIEVGGTLIPDDLFGINLNPSRWFYTWQYLGEVIEHQTWIAAKFDDAIRTYPIPIFSYLVQILLLFSKKQVIESVSAVGIKNGSSLTFPKPSMQPIKKLIGISGCRFPFQKCHQPFVLIRFREAVWMAIQTSSLLGKRGC